MDVFDKLKILTDAAKYDVACTYNCQYCVNRRSNDTPRKLQQFQLR